MCTLTPSPAQTSALLGNGDTFVQKDSGISIPAVVTKSGQPSVSGTVISWSGLTFTLNVTSGTLSTDYNGGTLNVAGITKTISTVSGSSVVNVTSSPIIPIELNDDDGASHPYQPDVSLMQESDSTSQNIFAAAYIRPAYDIGSGANTGPFKRNIENANAEAQLTAGRDSTSYPRFWTVYVQSAFQGRIDQDTDPNSEGTHLGRTPNLDSSGALVFVEAIRDYESNKGLTAGLVLRKVTTHETGHEFGLDHEDNSIMQQGYPVPLLFAPRHLNDIRTRPNP